MKNQNEYKLQVSCVSWFRYQYSKYYYNLFQITNSNELSFLDKSKAAKNMNKMKKSGLLVGCPDLFLSVPADKFNTSKHNEFYHGFYIEMKFGKNRQSENQKKFEKNIVKYGYKYSLCYSLDEFMNLINNYLK